MTMTKRVLACLGLGALCWVWALPPAGGQEERVRAKVGIEVKSGDHVRRAKSRDALRSGDFLRLHVRPEAPCHVYVVYADQKTATVLKEARHEIGAATLSMPSPTQYYQVDGQSAVERFTVICSPGAVPELAPLLEAGSVPYAAWAEIERGLRDRSSIGLTQDVEKPFAIAGNVRGPGEEPQADSFAARLPIFSGKSLVLRGYEFRVEK